MIQFEAWPKTPRYNKDIVVTEKIDGTNGAVIVVDLGTEIPLGSPTSAHDPFGVIVSDGHRWYEVGAQSRNRLVRPGKDTDNHGFAVWVHENALALAVTLGAGRHFGEWWGPGIARGYNVPSKRFSLFNTHRYAAAVQLNNLDEGVTYVPGLYVVPVIYQGPNKQEAVDRAVIALRNGGSWAACGFDQPEGVIVYHSASKQVYKVLLENDELPKSLVAEKEAA